jgi:hypothetical protein
MEASSRRRADDEEYVVADDVAPATPASTPTPSAYPDSAPAEVPASFVAAGLYPAMKLGYVSGDATFASSPGAVQADASTMIMEPHIDGVLTGLGLEALQRFTRR